MFRDSRDSPHVYYLSEGYFWCLSAHIKAPPTPDLCFETLVILHTFIICRRVISDVFQHTLKPLRLQTCVSRLSWFSTRYYLSEGYFWCLSAHIKAPPTPGLCFEALVILHTFIICRRVISDVFQHTLKPLRLQTCVSRLSWFSTRLLSVGGLFLMSFSTH